MSLCPECGIPLDLEPDQALGPRCTTHRRYRLVRTTRNAAVAAREERRAFDLTSALVGGFVGALVTMLLLIVLAMAGIGGT